MATKVSTSFDWLTQAVVDLGPGERVYTTGVPWSVYLRLSDFRDQRRRRMKITFDKGRMELMSPRSRHEKPHFRLSLVVMSLAESSGFKVINIGATTLRKEESEQGLEADESFYIANAEAVIGVDDIDLTIHPPPDLSIEVDLTSSSVSKEAIYARIGVPELWRHDDDEIVIRHLQPDGTYRTSAQSLAFPQVRSSDLTQVLLDANKMDEIAFWNHCRVWAKALLTPANP